jgi:hypothetical protein
MSIAMGFSSGGLPPEMVMALWVLINNGSKPSLWTSDRSIDEGQLCNIVFVNHIQDWLFLYPVHLWVQKVSLGSSFHFLVTIRRNDLASVVLWHTIDSLQGLRQSCRVKAVDRWVEISLHSNVWLLPVLLLNGQSLLIPIFCIWLLKEKVTYHSRSFC